MLWLGLGWRLWLCFGIKVGNTHSGINAILEALDAKHGHLWTFCKVIHQFLEYIVKDNYFTFMDKLYLQKHGTAMGTKILIYLLDFACGSILRIIPLQTYTSNKCRAAKNNSHIHTTYSTLRHSSSSRCCNTSIYQSHTQRDTN